MAGRPPKVNHIRDGFLASMGSALVLYQSVQKVGTVRPSKTCPRLHVEHVRRVVELAFMGVVATWEDFLEQTLVRYMAGARTDSGFAPDLRMGKCATMGHAYQVLTANPKHDPTKHYLTWTDPSTIVSRVELYMDDGHPYASPLHANSARLQDATRIRNRVAHSSRKCVADFTAVARMLLGKQDGDPLPKGYGAGDLLRATAARHFGKSASSRQLTFFEAYMELYQSLSLQIVPGATAPRKKRKRGAGAKKTGKAKTGT